MTALVLTGGSGAFAAGDGESIKLIPVGHTVGIKMFADGVVVVAASEVETADGSRAPLTEAGIRKGDVIDKVNGTEITSAEQLTQIVSSCSGESLDVLFKRGDREKETIVTPAKAASDGEYRIGALVRDSVAGIGTITFVDPETGRYGALGHGINDMDTGILIPAYDGGIMPSVVDNVKKGTVGEAGELHGSFDIKKDIGSLDINTESGIFGTIENGYFSGEPLEIATASEIETGEATILSNVAGDEVGQYCVEILKKSIGNGDGRNMLIKVTDPELLQITGGIVQGMSGSPIIQNGKLIGAVTHVMVDDPTVGYGIYIENMLNTALESAAA